MPSSKQRDVLKGYRKGEVFKDRKNVVINRKITILGEVTFSADKRISLGRFFWGKDKEWMLENS